MITILSPRLLIGVAAVLFSMAMLCTPPLRAGQTDIKGPLPNINQFPYNSQFGSKVFLLPNGNLVVTAPGFEGGSRNSNDFGAVYLYSPSGVMISRLTGCGEDASGRVSIHVLVLSNGHYVVRCRGWDNGATVDAGAVTWCSGVTGLDGRISPQNSLVGSRSNDMEQGGAQTVPGGMAALNNGNYVVCSPNWDNGNVANAGAVTWGDGNGGTVGVISPANSLTGSNANDRVGSMESGGGVTSLANGNYVVCAPFWDNGSLKDAGFAAWCSGAAGRSGEVSAQTALVGASDYDQVGGGLKIGRSVTVLANGNYTVCSPLWDKDGVSDTGAVTWCPGTGALTGPVTGQNSLTGSTASDRAGTTGTTTASELTARVTALSDGHYAVASSRWDNGEMRDSGAVTWCDGFTGTTGPVSALNSLTGLRNSAVGNGGVFALTDGDYAVCTPDWKGYGAVTRISGRKTFSGEVTLQNSLTGSRLGDAVGGGGITLLTNGNYVVSSPGWANGGITNAGAVTWCAGDAPLRGTVSQVNSLTGSSKDDRVGSGNPPGRGVTALTNGNYVVGSPFWDNAGALNVGAVTWCSGSSGRTGPVTAANSLTGSTSGDQAGGGYYGPSYGGVTALDNGNYVVGSVQWSGGTASCAGAVTWGNGAAGITGIITAANSLTGLKSNDWVGLGGVTALKGGNYVVFSPYWHNPAMEKANAGAVTLGDGRTGTTGLIHPGNSVPGMARSWGSDLSFAADATGSLLAVGQPGAQLVSLFTAGPPAKPVIRVEQPKGSLVSEVDFGTVSLGGAKAIQLFLKNPGYVPLELGGITLEHPAFALSAPPAGLLGPGDSSMMMVTFSPSGSGPQSAVLRIVDRNHAEGSPCEIILKGAGAPAWPVMLKDLAGPAGSGSFGHSVTLLPNGNIVVTDPYFDLPGPVTDAGAVYLFSPGGALLSTLTGSSPGDLAGIGGVTVLKNGHFVVSSPKWDHEGIADCGAVTWVDGNTGMNGRISTGNSLAGSAGGDLVGAITTGWDPESISMRLEGITALENGHYVVCSPYWNGGAGAVTWCDGLAGARGVVTAERSLTGEPGQRAGSRGAVALKNGNYVVLSPGWRDNQDPTIAGAVTWGSGASGIQGMISEVNSFVGNVNQDASPGEIASSGGVTALANGNYIIRSPLWRNGDAWGAGAVTWGSGGKGVAGRLSPVNSLTGTATGDQVGSVPPVILANGHYVILSPGWDAGGAANAGAVTWCDGTAPTTGPVSAVNSLIGTAAQDQVGIGGVAVLSNGNYVVCSSWWNNANPANAGAATWGDGSTGITGPVSAVNSFVGGAGQFAGMNITALTDGNYVVASSGWGDGSLEHVGAVTWANGKTGLRGSVSRENSLTGMHEHDADAGITVKSLPGGAFVVCSPGWNQHRGAATRCGPGGRPGERISVQNSLIGINDAAAMTGIIGVAVLSNGNYTVHSSVMDRRVYGRYGAVTLCAGAVGRAGEVLLEDSVTGTVPPEYGVESVIPLSNGNYLIDSPRLSPGSGVMTWGDGFRSLSGKVSPENSLTGLSLGMDDFGLQRTVIVTFATGHYAILCPNWKRTSPAMTAGPGAVVLGTGRRAFAGEIGSENSVLGSAPEGGAAMSVVFREPDRTFIVGRPADNIVSLFRHRSDTEGEATVEPPGGLRIAEGGIHRFEVVPVGESVSHVLTLKNTGTAVLRAGRIDAGGPPFSVTTPLPADTLLNPGESVLFTVTYTPSSAGLHSSILRLHSGGGSPGEIYNIVLAGASSPFGENGGSPGMTRLTDWQNAVSFKALPGVAYLLQRSEDLRFWTTLDTVTAGPDGIILFVDNYVPFPNTLKPKVFYRLGIP